MGAKSATSLAASYLLGYKPGHPLPHRCFRTGVAADAHSELFPWIMGGFYCGVVVLVNPSLVLTLAAIMVWAATRMRGRSLLSGPLLGFIVFLAVFLPWPIRNYRVLHTPILFRSNMGYELWQGNRFGSQGYFDATLHPNVNRQEFADYARLGEVRYMQEKSSIAHAAIMPTRPASYGST